MAALRFVVVAALLASVLAGSPHNTNQDNALKSALDVKKKAAEAACPSNTPCRRMCLYKSVGALDKDGHYAESGAVDLVRIAFPNLSLDEAKKVAKGCNSVNEETVSDCVRALKLSDCLTGEYIKIKGTETGRLPF